MKKILLFLLCSYLLIEKSYAQKNKATPVIFDTDMGPDYDDVGAIAILHAFADSGEANILATMASSKHANVAAALSVLNTYFQRPDIPIGVPKGWARDLRDVQHWTDTIKAKYPHKIKSNDEAEDAAQLYRKILAKQPDRSITVITVGFLTNLFELLKTGPDTYSPLSGKDLVKQKVKQLVSMAGKFPSGGEFNVDRHTEASKHVFETWPTEIIFSGFEIGQKIKTGLPLIHNNEIQNSPVKDVFRISIPMDKQDSIGRMSWDETAVLVAIAGYQPYYTLQRGKIVVSAADGSNTWINDDKGTHYYLIEKVPPAQVEKLLNDMMMHQPRKRKLTR